MNYFSIYLNVSLVFMAIAYVLMGLDYVLNHKTESPKDIRARNLVLIGTLPFVNLLIVAGLITLTLEWIYYRLTGVQKMYIWLDGSDKVKTVFGSPRTVRFWLRNNLDTPLRSNDKVTIARAGDNEYDISVNGKVVAHGSKTK